MSLPRVFITRPLPEPALEPLRGKVELRLGRPGPRIEPEEILAGARDAEALVPMLSDRVDRAVLEAAPRLRIVANYAAGYNNVDCAAAEALGIWVTNTPDATTDATADLAFGLLLAAARHLCEGERALRAGRFEGWTPHLFLGAHLAGATLGIVGMGRIGKAVARRASGFGMRILYAARRALAADEERALGVERRPLPELLAESDFVSLHVPLTPETRHLIDAEALGRMKPGAVLVNTARGPVVDEAALAEALHAGRLGGAGLDVYEDEPRVHPRLLTAPRAVLAPHLGTSTLTTRLMMAEKALGDVLRVLSGEPPRYPVNRPAAPRHQ